MKFMVDANVNDTVGHFLESRSYTVGFVNQLFLPGTPDPDIDGLARVQGWVILSYDQRFLKRIQQPRFGYTDPASSGYGRIMLMVRLSQQLGRILQCIDIIECMYHKAMETDRRLLLTVGPNFVRYDDQPLLRTQKTPGSPFGR